MGTAKAKRAQRMGAGLAAEPTFRTTARQKEARAKDFIFSRVVGKGRLDPAGRGGRDQAAVFGADG